MASALLSSAQKKHACTSLSQHCVLAGGGTSIACTSITCASVAWTRRWLVDLINATDSAGIPACATLTSVARHGADWGYNETTIWTGGTPGM